MSCSPQIGPGQWECTVLSNRPGKTIGLGTRRPYGLILVFGIVALVVLLGSLRWIPPLQSPDENAHLARAYAISQGNWQLTTPAGGTSGIFIDTNLAHFMHGYLENIQIPGHRPSEDAKRALNQLTWGGEPVFFPAPGTGYYNPLIYLPHASAWWLGEQLQLTIAESYSLVRMVCFAVSLLLLMLAYRLYPPNLVVSGLILLPMALFQMLMPTIDGICHSLLVLLLCWYGALQVQYANSHRSSRIWQHDGFVLGIFCLLIFVLSSARLHALPLILLIVFLPRRFSWSIKMLGFGLTLAAISLWIAYASAEVVDLRIARTLSNAAVVQFYLDHPEQWWQMISATLSSPTLLHSYAITFIGVLGWLHVQLPTWYYPWSVVMFTVLFIMTLRTAPRLSPQTFLVLGLIALGSIAVLMQALLITWTPIDARAIEGIQGRYFWIPACVAAFALGGGKPYRTLSWSVLLGLLLINTAIIWYAYARYYH